MGATQASSREIVKPVIVLIAAFGDNASVFERLRKTALSEACTLLPIDLPGFGAPPLTRATNLARLAEFVDRFAKRQNARMVIAHSASSIIASLAARRAYSTIDTVLSLEGNLTAEDAYFSGSASDFDNPSAFRTAFLTRLDRLAGDEPALARYRDAAAVADPTALWELGVDVRRFSTAHIPGEILAQTPRVAYLYNPANLPRASLDWLARAKFLRIRLDDATHWKCFDQPDLLAEKLIEALARL
jgi:pimeloyl-ACP methyl ester carboxylesterase